MRTILTGLALAGLALCSAVASRAAEPSPELIAYGKTLVDAGDCAGCIVSVAGAGAGWIWVSDAD